MFFGGLLYLLFLPSCQVDFSYYRQFYLLNPFFGRNDLFIRQTTDKNQFEEKTLVRVISALREGFKNCISRLYRGSEKKFHNCDKKYCILFCIFLLIKPSYRERLENGEKSVFVSAVGCSVSLLTYICSRHQILQGRSQTNFF